MLGLAELDARVVMGKIPSPGGGLGGDRKKSITGWGPVLAARDEQPCAGTLCSPQPLHALSHTEHIWQPHSVHLLAFHRAQKWHTASSPDSCCSCRQSPPRLCRRCALQLPGTVEVDVLEDGAGKSSPAVHETTSAELGKNSLWEVGILLLAHNFCHNSAACWLLASSGSNCGS